MHPVTGLSKMLRVAMHCVKRDPFHSGPSLPIVVTPRLYSKEAPVESEPVPQQKTRLLDMFAPSETGYGPSSTGQPGAPSKQMKKIDSVAGHGTDRDMIQIMLTAVENCKPMMKVQSIKSGTRIVHVPKVVMPGEQRSLAVRWIIHAVHQRKEASPRTSMAECLALELLLAYKREGTARQKRDDLHKLALENKSNVAGYNI